MRRAGIVPLRSHSVTHLETVPLLTFQVSARSSCASTVAPVASRAMRSCSALRFEVAACRQPLPTLRWLRRRRSNLGAGDATESDVRFRPDEYAKAC